MSLRIPAITQLFTEGWSLSGLADAFECTLEQVEISIRQALIAAKTVALASSISLSQVTGTATERKTRKGTGGQKKNRRPETAGTSAADLSAEPIKPPKRTGECSLHAGLGTNNRNECRGCLRDYQKDWAKRRKEQGGEAKPKRRYQRRSRPASEPVAPSTVGAAAVQEFSPEAFESAVRNESPIEENRRSETESQAEPGKVYSHPMRCPRCFNTHRFWKRANADESRDHWISMGCNNSLKIANYQINVDNHYRGGEAA